MVTARYHEMDIAVTEVLYYKYRIPHIVPLLEEMSHAK